jgi:hypothetical protein
MGFLDAFKAIGMFCDTHLGEPTPSLTHCEEFA